MKVMFNPPTHKKIEICNLKEGDTFILDDDSHFANYLYIIVSLDCASLTATYANNKVAVVNCKSGTTRLLICDTLVRKMHSVVSSEPFDG